MSTYKGIFGKTIKHLSSDPDNSTYEGQIWYNTTEGKFKTVVATAAWSSGSPLVTARNNLMGTGTITAGLIWGGGPGAQNSTEEFNGSGYSAGGNLNTARDLASGFGTQTSSVTAGGRADASPPSITTTEEYDGSTWTASPATINTSRFGPGGFGSQTAGAICGGTPPLSNATEEYNGTAWTSVNNMNTARSSMDSVTTGTQTTGIASAGFPVVNKTETYDGTTWTEVNSLNTTRDRGTYFGSQTAGVYGGGDAPPSPTLSTATETWDGTNWSTSPATLGTAKGNGAGTKSSPSTNGNIAGGLAPGTVATSEEYNFTANTITAAAWSSGAAAPAGNSGQSMAGNKTDAMMWGGDTGGPPSAWPTTSHSYNGSAWTADGTIPVAKNSTGQAGAGHTDATMFGGYTPPAGEALKTYEYNGSAWTAGGDLNDSRQYAYQAGGGTQTSAIAMGGGPNSAEHENYNGTSWSEETDFPSGANYIGVVGSQTATLAVSGANGTTATWDGSSWTAVPATLNTNRQYGAAGGSNSSEGYLFGGGTSNKTELYNGTTWSTQPNMANSRNNAGGSAVQSNGLLAGSFFPGNTAVEEFTTETTSLNIESVDNS